ncbi:hypothetical protein C8D70_10425 [Chryseobacterium sp. CBTAP 102]|nr:hypothetical protein C8D70_10425 [Chryseobacterium sp. CBTAP 102]
MILLSELMIDNINTHRYPNNIHATTGPTVFSKGIRESLKENPTIPFTLFNGIEFHGYLKFKYKLESSSYTKRRSNIGNRCKNISNLFLMSSHF